jgi:hypothetical protein
MRFLYIFLGLLCTFCVHAEEPTTGDFFKDSHFEELMTRRGGCNFLKRSRHEHALTNILFVDANTTSGFQNGSIHHPYSTIQAALNTIVPPTNIAGRAMGYTILIASGIYPEDLTITSNNNVIELVALGPVFLLKQVDPFTTTNVTINFVATALVDPAAQIGDSVLFSSLASDVFFNDLSVNAIATAGNFEITGTLFINDTSSVPNVTNAVSYKGSIISGINGTGSTKVNRLELTSGFVFDLNAPNSVINARDSLIGNMTALSYGVINSSQIGNITITQAPSTFTPSGAGIYSSPIGGNITFTQLPSLPTFPGISSLAGGTFNGPAGTGTNAAFLFDAATNFWFINNGGIINPPASKTVINSVI